MSYMTIDNVSAYCLTTCKTATPEDRFLFKTWIITCVRDLGPNRDWVKVSTLYPKDFSFPKPDDLVSTISIALYNASHQELCYNFNNGGQRIHTNRFAIYEQAINDGDGIIELSEDGFYYHLSTNATDVNYAQIKYLAMPVDEDGFPMIWEGDLMAYEAFCRWMWAKRENDNRSAIAQEYEFWVIHRDRAKGNRKMPNGIERDAIASTWLSLINAPPKRFSK
jgi:hypothetical protein